jgi:TonB family protein
MKRIISLLSIILFAAVAVSNADSKDLEQALRAELKGKVFFLRGFPIEDDLNFDSNFHPQKTFRAGSWAVAIIDMQTVRIKHDRVEIAGNRVVVGRDEKTQELRQYKLSKSIHINVDVPSALSTAEAVKQLIDAVFVADSKELVTLVPQHWVPYLNGEVVRTVKDGKTVYRFDGPTKTANGEPIYRASKDSVQVPKPVHTPDPEYTEIARAAGFNGSGTLSAVITKSGEIDDVVVVKPIGLGLDDNAAGAIRTWRFKPATKNGDPVAVRVEVEVTFNISR